ncbi:GLE1 [Babesia ovata]|uniref:mRNA export factor GLE1 n=1 Tax=Babesia ovata TaxID=189622 RepID=A0A2H6KEI2_9APIC|nr:GLE1 [Babesia ovata]GBE61397.1 GLE1 [Babesia ovata]
MARESFGGRRGVSLGLNEKVFRANRSIVVPSSNLPEAKGGFTMPVEHEIMLKSHVPHMQDNWQPTWSTFDHIEAAIERSIHCSTQPYVSILDDALGEVAKLEKQRAAKELKKQMEAKALQEELDRKLAAQKLAEMNKTQSGVTSKLQVGGSKSQSHPETESASSHTAALNVSFQATNGGFRTAAADNKSAVKAGSTASNFETDRYTIMVAQADYLPRNAYTQQIDSYEAEYEQRKVEYDDFVQNADPATKQVRLDIAKTINRTVNTLASTQKQVDHSYTTLVNIGNQYANESRVATFVIFRVIEAVLDCCEPGCQMYLNPKAAWPSAHLIRGLMAMKPECRAIYYAMIKKRCPYVIPRLYQDSNASNLEALHQYSKDNSGTYFKRQMALLRLHMAVLVVTKDLEGLWAWFAGFINASFKPVFKLPLSGVLITAMSAAGHFCLESYKEQFKKMLTLCGEMVKKGHFKVQNCDAADMYHEQLSHFFEEYRKKRTLEKPEGFDMKRQEQDLRRDI